MKIERFTSHHVEDAVRLALAALDAERVHVAALPITNFAATLTNLIMEQAEQYYGVVAIEKGRLTGYLSGVPCNAFKGLHRGVFCPLYAHGAVGDKKRVYQQMYQDIAAVWVRNGCLTHGISLYAHDAVSIGAWFDLAFGKRCIDAIRTLVPFRPPAPHGFTIRMADGSDADALLPLYNEDAAYFSTSPLFMALPQFYTHAAVCNELRSANHVWAAFGEDGPVGVMKLKPTGESFVANSPSVMNLYDVYLQPHCRGSGLATAMLDTIADWMIRQGLTHMGVDYESFNLLGARFWGKYFSPYTYSLMRRLDERVLWANGQRLGEILI